MRVSVIIPAYNAAATLRRAVASAVGQGTEVREILIVENNSTDATLQRATEIAAEDPDLIKVLQQPVQGASAARNLGIKQARGTWIQFLDADDELLPGKLTRQLEIAKSNTEWIIGLPILRAENGHEQALKLNPDPWKGLVYNGGLGSMNANLFLRQKLITVGLFDESLLNGVDIDLYLRLLMGEVHFRHDHTPCSVYHNHGGQRLSRQDPARLAKEELGRKLKAVQYLQEYKPAYFEQNAAYFDTAVLRGIRRLYNFDPPSGNAHFKAYFSEACDWSKMIATMLPAYHHLYPFFGFDRLEKLRYRLKHRK